MASLYFAQADFYQTNLDNFVVDGVGGMNQPAGPSNRCVGWQTVYTIDTCPAGDPVRNPTWGALKSLYR